MRRFFLKIKSYNIEVFFDSEFFFFFDGVSKTHQQAALDAAKRVLSYGTNMETVDILAVATNGLIRVFQIPILG